MKWISKAWTSRPSASLFTMNHGYQDWPVLPAGDEAPATVVLDHLHNHCQVIEIEGCSYRLRDLEQPIGIRIRAMDPVRQPMQECV